MAGRVIKGLTPNLQWLVDMLSMFQAETITIPAKYRERVLAVKNLLEDDNSGLVNTLLDFAILSAMVDFRIETDNKALTKILNTWLSSINAELRGKIPTGLKALSKEYYRERWKGSSQMLLRTFWEVDQDSGLDMPTTLFFVDGEDIKIVLPKTEGLVELGDENYAIRVGGNEKNDIKLPVDPENEVIFVQKPYESWGTRYPIPFIIRRGLYRNLKFLALVASKGEYVVGKALEYLMMIKKGTERMAVEGRAELTYDEDDLKKVSEDFKNLLMSKKYEPGTPTYTTNFDTTIEHLIPDYSKAINDAIYSPIERKILAGLGLVDIVEGSSSTRRESTLNPKPFIGEINNGVSDFKMLLEDVIQTFIQRNAKKHPKWTSARIEVQCPPVKTFMDDKFRQMLRSLYDRGGLSKRTFVEVVGDLNYDLEVERRKDEKSTGEDKVMFAPIIQNTGLDPATGGTAPAPKPKDNVPADKKGPEKTKYNQAGQEETVENE